MNKIEKMAAQDAHDWARAEMFFGEGAGIRRRHLEGQIAWRTERETGYHEAFQKFYAQQNMVEHAMAAAKERKKIDRLASVNKNFRAARNGNLTGLTNAAFLVVGGYYVARMTGADKVIAEKTKAGYKRAKFETQIFLHRHTPFYNIYKDGSNVHDHPTLFDQEN